MGKVKESKKSKKDVVDPLTTVKQAGVTKASGTPHAKAKQIANGVAKAYVNGKQKLKPKPVESSSEEDSDNESDEDVDSSDSAEESSDADSADSDDSDDSSNSDSNSGKGPKKSKGVAPLTNGKSKAAAPKDDDSDSDSDSESSNDEAEKITKPTKANGIKPKAKPDDDESSESSDSSDEEDDDDSDSGSDEESTEDVKAEAAKSIKPSAPKAKSSTKADASSSESEGDDSGDSEDDSEDDSDDSDDSDSSGDSDAAEVPAAKNKEEKANAPSKKRKAEADAEAPAKKNKVDTTADDGGKSATLFVGNLSWKVDDNLLYQEFEHCADILSARVVTDRESGRPRGFGYVDFANSEAAQKAFDDKQGAFLDGRDMRLDFAADRSKKTDASPGDRARKYGDVLSPESDTLFVGNVSFQADEDTLSAFFNDVANVKSLRLPTDADSGRLKGFAYVTFYSVEDAKKALETLNGQDCAGRNVRLDFSTPKPNREFGGGGFGGRGGGGGGGFGGRGGRGGGRGGGFGGRGGQRGGGRGGFGSNNRGSFQGKRISFD